MGRTERDLGTTLFVMYANNFETEFVWNTSPRKMSKIQSESEIPSGSPNSATKIYLSNSPTSKTTPWEGGGGNSFVGGGVGINTFIPRSGIRDPFRKAIWGEEYFFLPRGLMHTGAFVVDAGALNEVGPMMQG